MTKAPTPTEKSEKHRESVTKYKNATKTSITQQLPTDLGRSVEVTAINQTGVVQPVYVRTTFQHDKNESLSHTTPNTDRTTHLCNKTKCYLFTTMPTLHSSIGE